MLFEIVFSNFIFIIESCLNINIKTWHFLTVKVSIDIKSTINDLCIDTDCGTFMTNRSFIFTMISNYASKVKVIASLRVKDIKDAIVSSIEIIILDFSFSEVFNEAFAVAKLFRKIRIVDNLSVKIFIEMNIIDFEKMTINANTLIIDSCKNIKIDLSAISKDDSVKRVVVCALTTTISSHISMNVAIKLRERHELSSRDYMFHSQRHIALDREKEVFSHIVNSKFFKVMIINSFNQFVTLSKRCRLSVIKEFEKEECYIASEYDAHFATNNWDDASKLQIRTMLADWQTITFEMTTFDASKIVIDSNIIIYDTNSNQNKIRQVAKIYFKLWSDDDDATMKIPESDWMSINLLSDAKIPIAKVYSIGSKDKQLIDEMFNKLHKQERMKYIKYSTAHDYSVFVVWRTILKSGQESVRKDRVVIDIRELNKITETDNYFMSLQTDITSAVTECKYISVFDAAIFFYQWNVRLENRSKLTVIFHRGQEQFNVAMMSFKKSSVYVQRQIDTILRDHRDYSRVFIDDIVVYSKTLDDHIQHLHTIFSLLQSLNISLNSFKSFLNYSSMQLLEQKVNAFDLTTATEKIETIVKLEFFKTLKDFETYLDFIEWLRHYIFYFAQKSNSLQIRKVNLLRSASIKSMSRKFYSARTNLLKIIEQKLDFYEQIQKTFNRQKFLFHFDSIKTLYANIDAFKVYEFDVMIYHTEKFYENPANIDRMNVQSILFLSKMLTETEKRYWSTELEIAGLVWIVKKIRHMIEAAVKTTIFFTNHSAITSIARQISLTSSNTDKLNLRLVRASTYLSQFDLDVRYKSDKINIVSDALFRLLIVAKVFSSLANVFHSIEVFQASLIVMTDEFKKRILAEYAANVSWTKIKKAVENLQKRLVQELKDNRSEIRSRYEFKTRIDMNFVVQKQLIYHKERLRLCILTTIEKEIFELTHDKNQHSRINRCYARISESLYVSRLSKKLRQYIKHCSKCLLNQIKRHKSYEKLLSITSFDIFFHTIFINFIMSISKDMNTLLTVICKFFKRVAILTNKAIFSAEQWIDLVLERLQIADWRVFATIISDRDSKFLSEFWRALFKKLGVVLLTTIAYHAQTNEQSERTNQTVEIAIRYLVTTNIDVISFFLSLQTQFNNFSNSIIDQFSNDIIYEFKIRETLTLNLSTTNSSTTDSFSKVRMRNRQKTANAISFVNAHMKIRYDSRHKSLLLRSGDKIFLRLHRDYEINEQHKKLDNQRCEPFLIKKRVDRLTYELNILLRWKIHFVISMAQLESTSSVQNSYNRSRLDHSNSVYVENDIEIEKSYEMKRVIDKRIRKFDTISITQYKIKWREYDSEFDEWKSVSQLKDCMNLVKEYEKN